MEAFVLVIVLTVLGALASSFGADSRELDDAREPGWWPTTGGNAAR